MRTFARSLLLFSLITSPALAATETTPPPDQPDQPEPKECTATCKIVDNDGNGWPDGVECTLAGTGSRCQ